MVTVVAAVILVTHWHSSIQYFLNDDFHRVSPGSHPRWHYSTESILSGCCWSRLKCGCGVCRCLHICCVTNSPEDFPAAIFPTWEFPCWCKFAPGTRSRLTASHRRFFFLILAVNRRAHDKQAVRLSMLGEGLLRQNILHNFWLMLQKKKKKKKCVKISTNSRYVYWCIFVHHFNTPQFISPNASVTI